MEVKNYNNLLVEIEDGIAVITINRPKSLNALNSETLAELGDIAAAIEKAKDVKVVILTGSGQKSFVAGADISEMVNATPMEGRAMALLAAETFKKFENMPQVTIAAVNGYALGGGCEISMCCDIRIAAENAKFAQPEAGYSSRLRRHAASSQTDWKRTRKRTYLYHRSDRCPGSLPHRPGQQSSSPGRAS